MSKLFLVGVGDVVAMQGQNIVYRGTTELNTGIEVSTANTEVRAGQGNQLQYIYYHTGNFSINITDAQFSLPLIMLNTGATLSVGGTIWGQETATVNNGSATITGTPVAVGGATAYGYVEYNGTIYNCPYSAGSINVSSASIPNGTSICVGYFKTDSNASCITIPADIVPDRVHLFITAYLASDQEGSGYVGTATIEVPVAQLSGAQSITMTPDGYANTPITAMALAYSDSTGGCLEAYYAKITRSLTGSNWYDDVSALAIEGGDFTLTNGSSTTLKVWAVKNGRAVLCDNAQLTFTSATGSVATVGQHTGVITGAGTGSSLITAKITNKTSIEASCTVTVS